MQKSVLAAAGTYLSNGLLGAMLGPVVPALMTHFHKTYSLPGYLVFAQVLGSVIGVPLGARLSQRFGHRTVVAAVSVVTAVATMLLSTLPGLPGFYALLAIIGFGVGASEAIIASYAMVTFPGRRAVVMSNLEVAYAVGALISPAIASVFLHLQAWPWTFVAVSIIMLASTGLWLTNHTETVPDGPQLQLDANPPASVTASPHRQAVLLAVFGGITFLYVGVETSLNNFLPAIFIPHFHVPAYLASLSVSALWIAMVIGRVATGFVIRSVRYTPFLVVSSIAVAVSLCCLSLMRDSALGYTLVFAAGLFMSGIFSVNLVLANHSLSIRPHIVTSVVTLSASIGAGILPIPFGFALNHTNSTVTLSMLAAVMLLLTLAFLLVGASVRHAPESTAELPLT
ncbi:MFS transporter [Alicyclobacillus sp. ALC3]|uniref:MFS transporter n=1 Tax=Alicyclobacillus sp. ALC3 TaxID=2796143 RepID=UPI002379C3AE|nr:MFS transporter [Alicyclobacillus sp. ALC3]WDL99078.1 MFS transporter [Alicyclobacillus sp. ALC3]